MTSKQERLIDGLIFGRMASLRSGIEFRKASVEKSVTDEERAVWESGLRQAESELESLREARGVGEIV